MLDYPATDLAFVVKALPHKRCVADLIMNVKFVIIIKAKEKLFSPVSYDRTVGEMTAGIFITVDNGSEFADFAQNEAWGSKVYFAHPYSSWERAQNERHNGLFRAFIPKGVSMEQFSDEGILIVADRLNGRPRRELGYRTPEELFDNILDRVYQS